MFSGITQGLYEVVKVITNPGLITYSVNFNHSIVCDLNIGDSVAIDGVCQTVINISNTYVTFQAIQETLDKTTLSSLHISQLVSVERSIRLGDEIGGHEVSGHVDDTALIFEKFKSENNLTIGIKCNAAWMKYIFSKGFIALDGSSLTVGDTINDKGIFYIHLIPETIRVTNFEKKNVNDKVNLEIDRKTRIIVDTVENFLNNSTNKIKTI